MERVAMPDDVSGITCCYGKAQTVAALKMGAVEILLVSVASEDVDELTNLAKSHSAPVFEVEDVSGRGSQFCNSFIMGGCLRWPVDPELLDREEQIDAQHGDDEDSTSAGSRGGSICEVSKEQ